MQTQTQPSIVQRDAQPYAAIKVSVSMADIGQVVPPLTAEVFGWLAARGVSPVGPPFWKYNVVDMDRLLEIEAGVGVERVVSGDRRVISDTLPAGRYATLHHTGHPSTLIEATRTLLEWAAANSLTFDVDGNRWGARLELYLTDPQIEPDLDKWETELAFRLADA